MDFHKCTCSHCGQSIEYPAEGAGQIVPCPTCEKPTELTSVQLTQDKAEVECEPETISQTNHLVPSPEIPDDSPENYLLILKWYRKAAEQGDPYYQHELATALCAGLGVTQDFVEAAYWFGKSAEQGNRDSQFNLGACYWNGHGVAKDHKEGAKWLLMAAEQGDAKAQKIIAECCANGDGLEQDREKAYQWAKLAAAQNESGAQVLFDEIVSKMGPAEIKKGEKLFRTFDVKVNVATKKEGVEFMDLLRRFAEHGDIEAQQLLAQCCRDRYEAMKWTRKSAEQGSALAQYRLGVAYCIGDGVPENHAQGVEWLTKAVQQGNIPAHNELAWAYFKGLGVLQNFIEAYRLANIATAKGHEKARRLRDEIALHMSSAQITQAQRISTEKVDASYVRQAITSEVRREVWRRDGGKCVKCGSREKLEYDHIIPVAKGGSNTARNIELLCEACNRSKSASIQ